MWFGAAIGVLAFCAGLWGTSSLASETGDPAKGQEVYRACAACHSLAPGRHITGPSLAGIWGRKAGTVEGFTRYSKAFKETDIIWDEHSLDAWLANPRGYLPGNRMTFRGLPDETQRRDLIAFLRSVSEKEGPSSGQQAESMSEGTMSQGQILNLKALEANNRVTSISHCDDTYTVIAETGEAYEFWEFNLRFKTDGSENGPVAGHPVIIPARMRGDRAFVIFAAPTEISSFIKSECPQ
jgi:cytochrome c